MLTTAAETKAGDPEASELYSMDSGIFNKQQAKSGRKLYKKFCQSCHEGEYFGPVLLAWQGEPLSSLFEVMTSMMPENNPGGLKMSQYSDILAYVLDITGYPEGTAPLDPSSQKFSQIVIKPPPQN